MLLALLLLAARAHALDPDRTVTQFHHTAWTVNEGAPGQITALAQTTDGYLWLGTEIGLYRFDGEHFVRFQPEGRMAFPATSVSTLYATRDGGLWVGFRYGAVSYVAGEFVRNYGPEDGLPTSTVFRFAEDGSGRLWAATFTGPVSLAGERWSAPPPAMAFPGRRARTVFTDRSGTLWVATEEGVVALRPGARTFEVVTSDAGRISQFAQDRDGRLWVAEADGGVRPLDAPATGGAAAAMGSASAGLLFDRDGVLWATTLGHGQLRRVPARASGAFETFQRTDGLSSDYVLPILEDREGTIWVGSSRGLDRFRHANMVPVAMPDGAQDFAIVAGTGGALLVGTRNHPLQRVGVMASESLGLRASITAAHRDRTGVLWLGGPEGLWRMDGDAITRVSALPAPTRSGVQAIASTPDGALWLSLNTPGLHRYAAGRWEHVRDIPGLPDGDSSPLVLAEDSAGRLWMGFARNDLLVMERGRLGVPWTGEALDVGNVTALLEVPDGMWVGGERGAAFVSHGRLRNVKNGMKDDLRGITGIVRDREGDLWFNGARGVIRVRADDVPALFTPGRTVAYQRFDALDGIPGVPAQFRPLQTAARTDDGRLWFATTSGLVTIDPRTIVRNAVPPVVHVLAAQADGQVFPVADAAVSLPAGLQNLQIDFTALSLAIPERVRFRYRLDGVDARWRFATTPRSAFYSAPPPGRYLFRVAAANNDGVWSTREARVWVTIAPLFWQTHWFRALCIIAAVALAWALYMARMRRVSAQIRTRLDERHRERERIARELHDTLLQSTQGLILRLHAASTRLPGDDPVRRDLESAMDLAEQVTSEGRERVRGLRSNVALVDDLGAALLHVRDELHGLAVPEVRLTSEGTPRALLPGATEEAYMIGREALLNAFRHAQARTVHIHVAHGWCYLRMSIRDDGVGLPGDAASPDGHWGIRGMRERAERIGGTLAIRSGAPGMGTEVELRVPTAALLPTLVGRVLRWPPVRALMAWWRT